jgi:hypothetical protein
MQFSGSDVLTHCDDDHNLKMSQVFRIFCSVSNCLSFSKLNCFFVGNTTRCLANLNRVRYQLTMLYFMSLDITCNGS